MGTDDKKLVWLDKGKEVSFTLKDCAISSSALDSLKDEVAYYDTDTSSTGASGTYYGSSSTSTFDTYEPIRLRYDEYPTVKAVSKEGERIETLIKAITNLIKEVEELKKDNISQHNRISLLEEENKVLRNSMEEMYIKMVTIKDKTMILESIKADKEPATSTLASCC